MISSSVRSLLVLSILVLYGSSPWCPKYRIPWYVVKLNCLSDRMFRRLDSITDFWCCNPSLVRFRKKLYLFYPSPQGYTQYHWVCQFFLFSEIHPMHYNLPLDIQLRSCFWAVWRNSHIFGTIYFQLKLFFHFDPLFVLTDWLMSVHWSLHKCMNSELWSSWMYNLLRCTWEPPTNASMRCNLCAKNRMKKVLDFRIWFNIKKIK